MKKTKDEVANMMTQFTYQIAMQAAQASNISAEEFKMQMDATKDNVLIMNKKIVQMLINEDLMKNVE
jgi:hypothetical protein